MKKPLGSILAFFVIALMASQVTATPYNSLYAFGDSLSDGGNSPSAVMSIYNFLGGHCDPLHPCPPYFNGRYSNGPVAVEYLADTILAGGGTVANFHDFAVAGATTGIGNFGDGGTATSTGTFGLPGMSQELGLYLSASGGTADPGALYFVWGGANDFLTLDSPITAAQNIADYVSALAIAGATHVLVPNLPDLSLTPFVQSAGLQTLAQGFSVAFNNELAADLGNLSALFPLTDIMQFDTFSFLNDVVLNPGKYGLTDSQDACLPTPVSTPCVDPHGYVFWDSFHPTTQADAVIASAFARAVPEPATIFLFAAGVFALGAAGRPRRKTAQWEAMAA